LLESKSKSQELEELTGETLNILRLIRSENVGPKTFFSLLKYFGSAEKALENLPHLANNGGKPAKIKLCSAARAQEEYNKLLEFGGGIITYNSPEYPEILRRISDPPPVLSYTGNLELLRNSIIGIVGARNASAAGLKFTSKISRELGSKGYKIASGLARGIDTSAHKGAMDSGTIGVIAGGIDNIYPYENEPLYKNMKEHGLLLAEAPFGAVPSSQNFPRRNRIIAGLSQAVLVMEATKKSGSLITADFALEQNKEIFAVPGFPEDPRYQGTNYLIKQGAHILDGSSSVEEQINSPQCNWDLKENKLRSSEWRHDIDIYSEYEQQLKSARVEVEQLLSTTPVEIDELSNMTDKPSQVIHLVILELELAGKAERVSGDKVVKLY
jgi:DNA processing protein